MSDFRVEGKRLRQYSISRAKWYSNGFGFSHKVPFVYYFHKTLSGNHVETVIVTQSAPNGVSQNFAGVLLNELQLAPKGAAVSQIGELLQHCIGRLQVGFPLQLGWLV